MEFISDKEEYLRWIAQHCHCVNAVQSPDERRMKYRIVRSLTGSTHRARRMRDWPYSKIARCLGYSNWESLIKINLKELS